ncbi:MAG: NAD(P)-dependent oxidoreductase [Steroidobacteraceae bacterium]
MKVALIGATGNAGSRILTELLSRGHSVVALARHTEKLAPHASVTAVTADANDSADLAGKLRGVDAVISATKFKGTSTQGLIDAVRAAGVKRYLVVGGAGSLTTADGSREMDSPKFPPHVLPEAQAGSAFLDQLKAASDLDWTFLSPSRFFIAGERTGKFRLGSNQLLVAADGKSSISFEDYAIALVDELEQSRHVKQRFTVGY